MTRPDEDEDWILISPQPSPERVRNEQTQTEEANDSDIDILEKFDMETESIVSDFSFLRYHDLQVETCDFSDDFPDDEANHGPNLAPAFKAYSHVPNESINSQLNIVLIMSFAAVAGLAVGNYLEWSQSPEPDFAAYHQMMKLEQLQRELSTCKEHQVDGRNSSCLVTSPTAKCDSPVTSPAVTKSTNHLPDSINIKTTVALSGYVQTEAILERSHKYRMKKTELKRSTVIPDIRVIDDPEIRAQNSMSHHEIVIETRKYFPLSLDEEEKFGITVWLLLSQKGVSRPLFTSGLRRLQQIKKTHLDPFIETHYLHDNCKIWPEEAGISLIKGDDSIKNIAKRSEVEKEAQAGATGRFWSKIMKKVYKRGNKFGSRMELEEAITDCLLMQRQEYFTHLWYGFEKKVAKLKGRRD